MEKFQKKERALNRMHCHRNPTVTVIRNLGILTWTK